MTRIDGATYGEVERFAEHVTAGLRNTSSLEAAAQWFVERLVERYPSIVLARVFGTVPYGALPAREIAAADAAAAGVSIFKRADVLTLFGTAGKRTQWNDRRQSRAHLAIPLISRASVDEIPMVARLLSDLRYRVHDDPEPAPFVTRAFANANGLFYVPDAATTVDGKGRRIVPAADFVDENGIASVFGFGGSYVIQPMFVSTIVFTQERIEKSTAMNFLQLSSAFKSGTTRFVSRGLLFRDQDPVSRSG